MNKSTKLCNNYAVIQTRALFEQIDVNGDGRVSQAEFVSGLLKIPSIDCTEVEARRMFEKLDHNSAGMIYASQFVEVSDKSMQNILSKKHIPLFLFILILNALS